MSQSNNVLILGASGMLGMQLTKACEKYAPQFKLILQTKERFSSGVDLSGYLSQFGASTVINCIGYLGEDPALHLMVNGCMPRVIADWCDANGALCIHISTNAIFEPHKTRLWFPEDQPSPHSPYEVAKAFGEDPRSYIFRASFIGISKTGRGILSTLIKGDQFVNRTWNGVTVLTLAKRIVEVVIQHHGEHISFIEHVHSPDVFTFIDLAHLVGSNSDSSRTADDTRLLGGGLKLPKISEQLEEYWSGIKAGNC